MGTPTDAQVELAQCVRDCDAYGRSVARTPHDPDLIARNVVTTHERKVALVRCIDKVCREQDRLITNFADRVTVVAGVLPLVGA